MLHNILFWIKKINIIKTIYYSLRYGGKVICGKCSVTIRGGGKILIKNHSRLLIGVNYSYPVPTVIDLYDGVLEIKGNVSINRGCKIRVSKGATLCICDGTFLNEGAKVYCEESISIGANCAIAFDTKILDTDIHKIYRGQNHTNPNESIEIGNNVWIGTGALVLKGTKIESNTVIGANSIVKGHCKSNHIYAGAPIKDISVFDNWKV